MGMFDYIYHEGREYQTKDTPAQMLDTYEIRGTQLWYKSVYREWVPDSDELFGGHLEPISEEWQYLDDFSGQIVFYDTETDYLALFWEGEMIRIKELKDL